MCTHVSMNIYMLTTCQTVSTKVFPPTWGEILFGSNVTITSCPYPESKCPQRAQASPPSIVTQSRMYRIFFFSRFTGGSQIALTCIPPPTVQKCVTSYQRNPFKFYPVSSKNCLGDSCPLSNSFSSRYPHQTPLTSHPANFITKPSSLRFIHATVHTFISVHFPLI